MLLPRVLRFSLAFSALVFLCTVSAMLFVDLFAHSSLVSFHLAYGSALAEFQQLSSSLFLTHCFSWDFLITAACSSEIYIPQKVYAMYLSLRHFVTPSRLPARSALLHFVQRCPPDTRAPSGKGYRAHCFSWDFTELFNYESFRLIFLINGYFNIFLF